MIFEELNGAQSECRSYLIASRGEALMDGDAPIIDVKRVRVRQSRICQRIPRIGVDRLLEEIDRLGDALVRALVPGVAAAKIEAVRGDALRVQVSPGLRVPPRVPVSPRLRVLCLGKARRGNARLPDPERQARNSGSRAHGRPAPARSAAWCTLAPGLTAFLAAS